MQCVPCANSHFAKQTFSVYSSGAGEKQIYNESTTYVA